MDELEFYNGLYTGQQIDDILGRTGYCKSIGTSDNLNAINESGFYYWANSPINAPFGYGFMIVFRRSDTIFIQVVYNGNGGCVMRNCYSGTFSDWYWISGIPFADGTEYATAEKLNGKTVYAKMISFGSVTAGTTSTKEFYSGSTAGTIVRHSVFGQLSNTLKISLPYVEGANTIRSRAYYYSSTTWRARVSVDSNQDLTNVYGILYYTKD